MNTFPIGKNRRATAILRVSSAGQEFNTSFQSQRKFIEEYCAKHGLELVAIYEIVESASKQESRKLYVQSISQTLAQKNQHVVFFKFDREARNFTDMESNERHVRSGDLIIHYVADGKVFHKDSPDADFLQRDFQTVLNKHYSRELSTKVRLGQLQKAESGWFPQTIVPLGYIHQKQKNDHGLERRRGTIIVRDPDPRVVAQVYREFELRGIYRMSLPDLRRKVIEEGYIPRDKITAYTHWNIERRLRSKFYDQRFDWQGVEYRGKHERIIPKELFDKVQESFGARNCYVKSSDGIFGGGWLKCADPNCGCHIVFDPKVKVIKQTGERKEYRYYHCTNGKKVHPTLKGLSISEEKIWHGFTPAVSAISITENFAKQVAEALNQTKVKAQARIKEDLGNFNLQLASLEKEEDEVYRDYKRGILDDGGYQRQFGRIRGLRKELTQKLEAAQLQINDAAMETAKSILELATNAESQWKRQTPQERKVLLDTILSNQVLDGATIRYEMKKPFHVLSGMRENQMWRRE